MYLLLAITFIQVSDFTQVPKFTDKTFCLGMGF